MLTLLQYSVVSAALLCFGLTDPNSVQQHLCSTDTSCEHPASSQQHPSLADSTRPLLEVKGCFSLSHSFVTLNKWFDFSMVQFSNFQSETASALTSSPLKLLMKITHVKKLWFSSSHVWMWELDYKESWGQRINAFKLWYWRRLLRVPWTARSNQSILKV